jgi:hypothetical protein
MSSKKSSLCIQSRKDQVLPRRKIKKVETITFPGFGKRSVYNSLSPPHPPHLQPCEDTFGKIELRQLLWRKINDTEYQTRNLT